nr:monodehydroascorbate reductase [Tanacetum cinerariifolium]
MSNVNVDAPADQAPTMAPPTRTDDQILPHIRWDTVRYDKTVGCYKCQLDEQWFDLTKDTLRDALQITPINDNNAFSSPPTPDALINSVNNLGYPKVVINLSDVVTNDMFQPWRALTTIINLCLTGKTLGFERPRAPVLQILWGKKATLIVILSVRFTKLVIYYLQSKHKFHPRLDSPFYFPNEEPVLGYLKFGAKGTKREVFEMPIPNKLIIANIQGEQYYKEYLKKVAKHQRYLVDKKGSDPDSPVPKPAKATKKSKPSAPKADLRPPVTKPASSQQPQPKPAPAKSQGKKLKLVTKMSDKPSPARRSKPGLVTKRRKPTSSLRSVDESVDEGIPDKEPRFDDEEADIQMAVAKSLKSVYDAPRGPLPPVVIREPDSGKYQPLLEIRGKGKEKVSDEQVALDLLTLQTPKKKTPADKFIFQRCTSTPTESSGHDESSSLYDELGLTDSEVEFDEDVPGIDAGVEDDGQAGLNPGEQDEGQAGPNPGDATASQPQSSPVVHAGPNLEHTNLEENLKLTVEEQVILEEPASSTGTLSSLQHLAKGLSFGDLSMNRYHTDELLKDLAEARRKKKKRRDSPKTPPRSPPHQPPPPPPPTGSSGTTGSSEESGSAKQDWWKPFEEYRPVTPEPSWSIPSSNVHVLTNNWASALVSTYAPPPEDSLDWRNVSKPLPLGGPPGKVTIQSDFFFNKDLKYLRYGSKGSRPAYTSEGDRKAVRTHMRILSVVRIEVFSMYVYDYMKKIVLRRADLHEHIIAERDFKYLYLSDFEDLYLLNLQGHMNHLPPKDKKILTTAVNLWTRNLVIRQHVEDFQLGIESYQTQLNLTKPRWNAMGFEYKHDYKFSDGTLHQIDEALDYRVKEFKVNRMNPSLNTRFWTRKDMDRSKEVMFAIQKRLKTRRIFRNLESFVGGRSMNRDHTDELLKDLAEARRKKKKRRSSGTTGASEESGSAEVPPPPTPPPSTNQEVQLKPFVSSIAEDLHMDDDLAPDAQAYSSHDEDIGNAHIPKVNMQKYWWKPFEEDRPVTPEPSWSIPSFNVPILTNNWASALASTYAPPPEDSLEW